jgi:hypothetical protein
MKNIYLVCFALLTGIASAQVPTASFVLTPTVACPNQTLQITNVSTGATSYTFVLDGSSSVVATNPVISFSADGNHYVELYAENTSGISSPFGMGVLVNPAPVVSTGTAGTSTLTPSNGQTTGWSPMVLNFADPLPTGAVLSGITLTFSAVDQGWGGTGATANLYVAGKLIGGATLSHSLQNFTLSIIAPFPNYSYGGSNALEMYFVGWAGWQAFFTNGALSLHYQTNSAPFQICGGNAISLNAIGASTYIWMPLAVNGQSFIPLSSALYTVSGTNTFGCVGTATQQVTVSTPSVTAASGAICAGQNFAIVPTGAASYTINGGQFTVTPQTSTAYSVVGTGTDGCVSVAPTVVNVTVVPLPTVSVNSGTVCSGGNFTLQPSGASTYSFQNGTNVQTITASNNFTVMGYNSLGCAALLPAMASVTMIALPQVSLQTAMVCLGTSYSLHASGASSYTYSSGTAIISPTATASYTVIGANAFGCEKSASATILVSACAGINEVGTSASLQLAPNPCSGIITVSAVQDCSLQIFDQTGRLIKSLSLQKGEQTLDLQMAPGLYYLSSNASTHVTKLIVQ